MAETDKDIDARLEDTTKACLEAYKKWAAKKTDADLREELQEAVHDVRKVVSRLEIEMAVSERADMAEKPLPIPPHKSQRKNRQQNIMDDDNFGNGDISHGNGNGNGNGNGGGSRGPRRGGSGGGRGRKPKSQD